MGGDSMLFRSQTLVGRNVVNAHGEDLGRIEEFVIDPERGRIEYAVLSFGEPFGIGEKFFAVPWEALRLDCTNNDFVMNVEMETLEAGQGFDPEAWPHLPDRSMFPPREPADESGVDGSDPSPTGKREQTISVTERTGS